MKLTLLCLMTILMSAQSVQARPDFNYEPFKVFPKKETKTHITKHKTHVTPVVIEHPTKDRSLIKRGKKVSFYSTDPSTDQTSSEYNENKKKFFQRYLKNLKSPILVSEVDNGLQSILKIKIADETQKYDILEVKYKFNTLQTKFKTVATYQEGAETFANIDIKDLPFGEYKIFFEFGGKKIHQTKKKVLKAFLGEADLEKTLKVIALLDVTHTANRGYARVDASNSFSDAGSISQYDFNIYKDNTLIDSLTNNSPAFWYTFRDVGTFDLEVVVTDSNGNKGTSDKQSVTITNSSPTLAYTLTPREGLPGHYTVDFSASFDADGDSLSYYRLRLDERTDAGWVTHLNIWSTTPIIHFSVPHSGTYSPLVRVYDETFEYDSTYHGFTYDGPIAPKYLGHFFNKDDTYANRYHIGADFRDDTGIDKYYYKATHEDGTVATNFYTDNRHYNFIDFQKTGNYTVEYYAVDTDGLKSDVITQVYNVHWDASELVPVYQWHYAEASSEDPRIYWVGSFFYDMLGSVVRYDYKATHTDGTQIISDRVGEQHVGFWFTKKGDWTIEITATDNEGFVGTHSFTKNITWAFENPVASIELSLDANNPYRIHAKNNSYPINWQAQGTVTATHEGGESFNFPVNGEGDFYADTYKRGAWTIEYKYTDAFGLEAVTQKSITIQNSTFNLGIVESTEKARSFVLNIFNIIDPYNLTPLVYNMIATHESGYKKSISLSNTHYEFSLEEPGNWNIEVQSIDNKGIISGISTKEVFVPRLAPIALFNISKGQKWNEININATWSHDSDGYISNYHFEFIHSSGFTKTFDTQEQTFNYILPEIDGLWSIRLTVTDNEFISSEVESNSIEILFPSLSIILANNSDNPYVISIEKEISSPIDLANQSISALHESGEVLSYNETTNLSNIELSKRGSWQIIYSFTYPNGKVGEAKSSILLPDIVAPQFSINKIRDLEFEANITTVLTQTASINYEFELKVVKDRVLEQSLISTDNKIKLDPIFTAGVYLVELRIRDSKGVYSQASNLEFETLITLPEVDGDIIPPMPDPVENNRTIAGVDIDKDGIRDDIEVLIQNKALEPDKAEALKRVSKTLQAQMLVVNDREKSVGFTYNLLDYNYCLKTKFTEEEIDQFQSEIKGTTYNTKARVLAWVQTQINFAGKMSVLDTDEDNYHEYCE